MEVLLFVGVDLRNHPVAGLDCAIGKPDAGVVAAEVEPTHGLLEERVDLGVTGFPEGYGVAPVGNIGLDYLAPHLGDHVDEVFKQDFRDLAIGAGHEVFGDGVAGVDTEDALAGLTLVFVGVGEGGVGDSADLLAGYRHPPYAFSDEVFGEVVYQEGGGGHGAVFDLGEGVALPVGEVRDAFEGTGGLVGQDAASGVDGLFSCRRGRR